MRLARLHRRIRNIRQDFLHKSATTLAKTKSVIVVENLNVRGMMRNHHLARHIGDAAWSEMKRQLAYKTTWYGSSLVQADRWLPSSKTCHDCGHVVDKLPLSAREWICPKCGIVHDRDVNAAVNLAALAT
jgi:putative transposase